MGVPFLARTVGALIFFACWRFAARRILPSRWQRRAAMVTGLVIAIYDLIGEMVLYRLGVWEYRGGLQLGHVPIEMPIGFVPCAMAACCALIVPARLRQRRSRHWLATLAPTGISLLLITGTLLVGALIDSTFNPWTGSVVYKRPWLHVMAYVVPFWGVGALLLVVTYPAVMRSATGSARDAFE